MVSRVGRFRVVAVAGAALGLSGCVTDPAFLEGLAMATEAIAADTARMAEDARCYRHLSLSGEWVTLCPLPPGVVVHPPYKPTSRHDRYRDHDRDYDRDPGDRRGHPRRPR